MVSLLLKKNIILSTIIQFLVVCLVCLGLYLLADSQVSQQQLAAYVSVAEEEIASTKADFAEEYKVTYVDMEVSKEEGKPKEQISEDIVWTESGSGWPADKVTAANTIYSVLHELNFEDQLICGFVGNMMHEGTSGMIEAKNNFSYWNAANAEVLKIAGTVIKSEADVDTLLNGINPQSGKGIGVGFVQWSGSRRVTLLKLYKSEKCTYTPESIMRVEAKMLANECGPGGSYGELTYGYYEKNKGSYNDEQRVQLATGLVGGRYEVCHGYTTYVNRSTWLASKDWVRTKSALHAYKTMGK